MTAAKLLIPLLFGALIGTFWLIEPALAKSSIGIGSGEVTPQPSSGFFGVLFVEVTSYRLKSASATQMRHGEASRGDALVG